MFHNPFPNAFGLDISDLSVKVVQLRNVTGRRRKASYRLVEHRAIDLPHGLILNGELEEPEKVRQQIDLLIHGDKKKKKKGMRGNWVVASLPESQSFIKLITINKTRKDITDADIHAQAAQHIPFDPDSYCIDWHVIPHQTQEAQTHMFIGAIPKAIANSYTYLLESLGLGVIAIELEALAVARAMITATKVYDGEARAILDLGATRSSLIIYDHDSIQFSMSLPFSGELMTTALSQKLGISYEEAEKKKRTQGLDYQENKGQGLSALSPMVDQLVTGIQRALGFYATHFQSTNQVTHVTMCGGGANLKNLGPVLTEKLGIESAPGHPWKNLGSKKKIELDAQTSLSYAAAIGLALRAADNPFLIRDMI